MTTRRGHRLGLLDAFADSLGDVTVIDADLPASVRPGVYWPDPPHDPYILLDERLDPQTRDRVLGHELAHHLRGGGIDRRWMPRAWRVEVVREERYCDALGARLQAAVSLEEIHAIAATVELATDTVTTFGGFTCRRAEHLDRAAATAAPTMKERA